MSDLRYVKLENQISEIGLDLMDYNKWGRYRIRLSKSDVNKKADFITQLLKKSYSEAFE